MVQYAGKIKDQKVWATMCLTRQKEARKNQIDKKNREYYNKK